MTACTDSQPGFGQLKLKSSATIGDEDSFFGIRKAGGFT
jgi:hypothetical protein